MKMYRFIVFLGLFTSFFISGMVAGRTTVHLVESILLDKLAISSSAYETAGISKTPEFPIPASQTAISTSSNESLADARQRNILIIGVDQLNLHQARLESVWLAMYIPNYPQVTLMPVYPKILSGPEGIQAEIEADLASKFHLDPGNYPDPGFLAALEEKDIWWTNFIVLDASTIDGILNFITDEATSNRHAFAQIDNGSPTMVPSTSAAPLEGLLAQVNIAQEICRAPAQLKLTPQALFDFAHSILSKTGTDITTDQAIQELQYLIKYGGRLICEFPFIAARPVP